MAEHLELPRPLRLVRTAAWSLSESAGLPIGAIVIAAWLGGRDIGILTGLGVTCVIAAIRKLRTGTIPGLLAISVMLPTVQTIVVLATGSLWIFLLLAASLAVLLATEPTATFILLSSLATISFVAAGTGASIVWFLAVLRRHGLSLRFAPS